MMKMPTNEERREVAARLRVLADENTVTATPSFNHELFAALGLEPPVQPSMPTLGDLEAYDQALLYRLADLIEPGMRTCRMKQHRCTNCDHEINDRAYFEKVVLDDGCWTAESRTANFCPNCGAKVASDD